MLILPIDVQTDTHTQTLSFIIAVCMLDSQSRGPVGKGSSPTTGEVDTFWAGSVQAILPLFT